MNTIERKLSDVSFNDCGRTVRAQTVRRTICGRTNDFIVFEETQKELIWAPKRSAEDEARKLYNDYVKPPQVRSGAHPKYLLCVNVYLCRVIDFVQDGETYRQRIYFHMDGRQDTTRLKAWNYFECDDIRTLPGLKVIQTVICTFADFDGYGRVNDYDLVPNDLFPLI